VSTKDQNCELQLRDLRVFCSARNFTVIREYVDIGESGAKDSRPQLNELLVDARKRKLDAIVVWRFDRFARSTKHLLLALEEFLSLGIQFVSYQENIDTSSPLGQAVLTIVSAVALLERDPELGMGQYDFGCATDNSSKDAELGAERDCSRPFAVPRNLAPSPLEPCVHNFRVARHP
jgi:Resolvase, N terminal domain